MKYCFSNSLPHESSCTEPITNNDTWQSRNILHCSDLHTSACKRAVTILWKNSCEPLEPKPPLKLQAWNCNLKDRAHPKAKPFMEGSVRPLRHHESLMPPPPQTQRSRKLPVCPRADPSIAKQSLSPAVVSYAPRVRTGRGIAMCLVPGAQLWSTRLRPRSFSKFPF